MTVEELAKLYQDGTEWNDEMEAAQNKVILEDIQDIYNKYEEHKEGLAMTFEQYVGLRIGTWQADVGFMRALDIDALRKMIEEEK